MRIFNQGAKTARAIKRQGSAGIKVCLTSAVMTVLLVQGCSGEAESVNRYPDSSVAEEFISEKELAKLLSFSQRKTSSITSYYTNYTASFSTPMSRDLMMSRVSAEMKDFPQILSSAEVVFEDWRKRGKEHVYTSTYNGRKDINVAILRNYLDEKYSDRDIGEKYGISNQRLAHIIIQSNGLHKTFHRKIQGYVEDHQG